MNLKYTNTMSFWLTTKILENNIILKIVNHSIYGCKQNMLFHDIGDHPVLSNNLEHNFSCNVYFSARLYIAYKIKMYKEAFISMNYMQ